MAPHQRKKGILRTFTRADALLIGGTILVAGAFAAGSLILSLLGSSQKVETEETGPYVVIQNPQGIIYTGALQKNTVVTATGSDGYNIIEIQDGEVWVSEADCPTQVCVKTGKVHRVGAQISCLPHKLLIEVVAKPEDASQLR